MIHVKIITNNPDVSALPGAEYYEETLPQILERVRDLVHKHFRLLTHPLAGSIKPNETPYKSVALFPNPGTEIDLQSLQIIESAIQTVAKLLQDRATPVWNNRVRADFALIDLSLLQSGLDGLKHF